MIERQPGTGTHLGFHTQRQFDGDAAGNGGAAAGRNFDITIDGCQQIQARCAQGGIMRQRKILPVGKALQSDFHEDVSRKC